MSPAAGSAVGAGNKTDAEPPAARAAVNHVATTSRRLLAAPTDSDGARGQVSTCGHQINQRNGPEKQIVDQGYKGGAKQAVRRENEQARGKENLSRQRSATHCPRRACQKANSPTTWPGKQKRTASGKPSSFEGPQSILIKERFVIVRLLPRFASPPTPLQD